MLKARLPFIYILGEMLPGFILGVMIFVFILLMFQILRLTEFVLQHGVDVRTIGSILVYLTVSFLPAVLPMSLLFCVLMAFGRLSNDSEIVAFKALGLHMGWLSLPAVILGASVAFLSAHTSFYSAPWGNRQFELLVTKLGNTKAAATIREGTFSEGFFDLVVYTNKVDSQLGTLHNVFIYDERDPDNPITIIARDGQIIQDEKSASQNAQIRLYNGNIHRTARDTYTKIDFEAYDINLNKPQIETTREKSILSLSITEIKSELADTNLPPERRLTLESEYHKRLSISVACLVFAFLGAGLGTNTNRRSAKSGSLVMSLVVIVGYWAFYVAADNLARKGAVTPWVAMWSANVLFALLGIHFFRRSWR